MVLDHVIKFARWQHPALERGARLAIPDTKCLISCLIFESTTTILYLYFNLSTVDDQVRFTRDIDIAILSVRPSVCHVAIFCRNGLTYCLIFFTAR